MPFFKSTHNILLQVDQDEVFDINWMDSDKLVLPPKKDWDYGRELQIEDINIWEVLYESSGGVGVYAAWDPYAEFYLITYGLNPSNPLRFINDVGYSSKLMDTYYGQGAQEQVQQRMKELRIPFNLSKIWVEPEDMWLYTKKESLKIISY
jgi:hypothetical protein